MLAPAMVLQRFGRAVKRAAEGAGSAVVLSLLLHGVIFSLFIVNWERPREQQVVQPRAIRASLVELAPKPAAAAQRRTVTKPSVAPKPAPKPASSATPRPTPKPAATPKPKPAPSPAQSSARRELLERSLEQQTVQLSDSDADQSTQLTASYVEAIVGRLTEAWSRPPSARLGMSATLRIATVPTGRVVAISVLHSSGDEAFDRSVQLAVERVGQFAVIAELYQRDAALFERQFRQLDIIFSPEDLRL